ncbi:MAG: hypothetical protein KC729_12780 [Candidatus Eisenbacteria bacterium]|uniref:Uncharacterized protein n=1 Tax=Eiseniibacteriota bacterium TaxID=2212470 RepID=A0A956M269_UNCEI|nr:hypothetical protein [Candidatus Eisenbacteria bacterium]
MRYVDTELDRPRWRSTANLRLHRMLQAGVEYNPAAGEISPLATVFLVTESERRPAVFLGTSSDRIGSPEGTQSYYLTVAKQLPSLPFGAYASLNYSEWSEGFNVPFGADVWLGRGFSVRPMFDGDRSHLMGTWSHPSFSISALYVWFERWGLAVSTGIG